MKPLVRIARCSAALAAVLAWPQSGRGAKIACVGDSITAGYGLGNPDAESYPAVLAARLGSDHTVRNFGVSGTTLLKNGDLSYWGDPALAASGAFEPDVVVIVLGTNDSKPQNWSHEAEFSPDYRELIANYRTLGALVYVATPPPVYPPGAFDIRGDVLAEEIVPLIRTIATEAEAPLVDVFIALGGKPEAFPDNVHPNAAGAALIADAVFAALEENGLGGAGATAGAGGAAQGGQAGAGAGGSDSAGAGGTSSDPAGAGGASGGSGNAGFGGISASAGTAGLGGAAAGAMSGSSGSGVGQTAGRSGAGGASGGSGSGLGGMPNGAGGTQLGGGGGDTANTSGAGPADSPGKNGCGCRLNGSDSSSAHVLWTALALVFARTLRRRRAH